MPYTDDPIADFNKWDAEQENRRKMLPRCCECGKHIQDDELFDVYGDLYCWDCAIKEFRRSTDYYIDRDF